MHRLMVHWTSVWPLQLCSKVLRHPSIPFPQSLKWLFSKTCSSTFLFHLVGWALYQEWQRNGVGRNEGTEERRDEMQVLWESAVLWNAVYVRCRYLFWLSWIWECGSRVTVDLWTFRDISHPKVSTGLRRWVYLYHLSSDHVCDWTIFDNNT